MPTTIIIPSKQEKFLNKTIQDVLTNATGEVEVIVTLDGYEPDEMIIDDRLSYILLDPSTGTQKRHGINAAVSQAKFDHIMALDAHCMVCRGFDEILEASCEPDWVMIPRRKRLDADNWCIQADDGRPDVDYEYPMWQDFKKERLHSYKWAQRSIERRHIPIDETMGFQGSCYFMHKDYFYHLGLMQTEGYGGFAQESEEITRKVWVDGGKIMTNKNAWYAHLHKGKKYGRMYDLDWKEVDRSIAYSFNSFVNENRDTYIKLIEHFWPIPNWPENWEDYLK